MFGFSNNKAAKPVVINTVRNLIIFRYSTEKSAKGRSVQQDSTTGATAAVISNSQSEGVPAVQSSQSGAGPVPGSQSGAATVTGSQLGAGSQSGAGAAMNSLSEVATIMGSQSGAVFSGSRQCPYRRYDVSPDSTTMEGNSSAVEGNSSRYQTVRYICFAI